MKNIQELLSPNEHVQFQFKPDIIKNTFDNKLFKFSILIFIATLLGIFLLNFSALIIIFPFLLATASIVPSLITYQFTTYYITNAKVIIESGIIGKDFDIIKLEKIIDTNIDVGIIDSILGTGAIKLCTANDSEPMIIKNIRGPKKIMRYLQN